MKIRTAGSVVAAMVAALAFSTLVVPAQAAPVLPAAADRAADRSPGHYRTTVPVWVSRSSTVTVPVRIATSNVNVDWQWLRGGWVVKFNWAETRQMSRGFGYCTAIASLASPTVVAAALAAGCSIMWVVADVAVNKRQCIQAFVPVSLINSQLSFWRCPT